MKDVDDYLEVMTFKTKPYYHQAEELMNHSMDENRAIFWEMGCGKSKLIVDNACELWTNGHIGALIILAPNIVHMNWILREFPAHCWDEVPCNLVTWQTKMSRTKRFKTMADDAQGDSGKLLVLAMNYDALRSQHAMDLLMSIMKGRTTMLVCDESSRVKNFKTQVSKACMKLGRYAKYKRILTGTPYTTGPFNIYSQMRVLDPHYLGFKTYTEFKYRYGVFQTEYITRMVKGERKETTYQSLVNYRNLEELKRRMDPISTRLTKFDCLDLPARSYQKYEVSMTSKQQAMYDTLRDELVIFLENKGVLSQLEAQNALSLLLRLQQIAGGHVLHGETMLPCDKVNPKLDVTKELVEDIIDSGSQVVVWSRFQPEIDMLVSALSPHTVVEYHGRVSDAEKNAAIDTFQAGEAKVLIGNQASGGMGITLTAACYMLYYSNSFSLDHRLQSEARIHRIGQTERCIYIDIMAKGSVDYRTLERLKENKDLATILTGDKVREWIT